jgi:two-component system, NarL family, nitrate/nitrite response regulator NarL
VDAQDRGPARLSLRVLVVADDPLARSGLAALLGEQAGITVVGQAASTERIGRLIEVYDPEAVVLDLGTGVPDRSSGLDLAVPVLALARDGEHAVEALAAGARAVLLRDTDGSRLVTALTAVTRGLLVLDEALREAVRPRAVPAEAPVEALTPREREVLQLLSEGLPNRRIAERLGIGERTVKFHVNAILGKLGVSTRTEAVVVAARLGLVSL